MDYEKLQLELLDKGIILINGEINKNTYGKMRDGLLYLKTKDSPDITIEIESHGGDWDYALLICSLLKEYNGKITGIAKSHCISAGFDILQACDKRVMHEHCRLKTHEVSFEFNQRLTSTFINKLLSGNEKAVKLFTRTAKHLLKDDKKAAIFFAKRSGGKISKKKVYKIMKKDKPISAKKAIKYGLVDEIISHF